MTNKNIIKYGTDLINSRFKLTENELDMLYILSAQIDKDDKDFANISFSISDLEAKTGKEWKHQRVKESLKSLNTKPIEIVERDEDGELTGAWEVIYWLSTIKHRDGIITVRFQEQLKPFLLELKGRFEQIPLKNALQIGTTYAKRIYVMLKEYEKIGHRVFDLDELRELLKTPKSYKDYSLLRSKVLDVAVAEINKHGDIKIAYEETKKRGRKVVEIKFTIRKNDNDLQSFIANMRECYVNVTLFFDSNGHPVKCAEDGKLYDAETLKTYDAATAQKCWEWMHEHQKQLECFKPALF